MAEATAPGSSANLGPGFDTLALALEITCRVVAVRAPEWMVSHHGPHAPAPGDDDAVLLAARTAVGAENPLKLEVYNEIPLGRGLGSSAAAFVAGAAAGLRAVDQQADTAVVLRLASDLEGHADNVAASVFGGLVAAVGSLAQPLVLHPSLRLVIAVPSRRLPTKWARQALPEIVEHDVAARSVARVVALVEAFRTADPRLFAAAAGDELHEAPRGPLFPEAEDLMFTARSAGAVHTCWSGAGPSILAVVDGDGVEAVATALREALGSEGTVLLPAIAFQGLR
ncbi:MAG: homoserine kinase [Acidimicrobiia bacterium]|nr:homoserine kinase [Acidimicrobiia bacterium]